MLLMELLLIEMHYQIVSVNKMTIPLIGVRNVNQFNLIKVIVRSIGAVLWFAGCILSIKFVNGWLFLLGFFLAWFCFYFILGVVINYKPKESSKFL